MLFPYTAFSKEKNRLTESRDNNEVHLILDTLNIQELPENFRKTSDYSYIDSSNGLDLTGLDTLNISGSQQFSQYNLPLLLLAIGTSLPITSIDLRQESHGFINGLPVSLANEKNNANEGLTKTEVLLKEAEFLTSINLNQPITFYNYPDITIIPFKVENEEQLVNSRSLSYIRIPVTDGKIPTDDMVDYFVEIVRRQPLNSWLHFNCKAGVGRTTTFMIMYDMMKNSNKVTAEDIIKRQLLLANFDEQQIESFYNRERAEFLANFYEYCKEKGNSFNTRWSKWKKTNPIKVNAFIPTSNSEENTCSYIKNSIVPNHLFVISQDLMTASERTMIATLQGVVSNHCSSQIYTLNSSQPDYQIWLEDLRDNYGVSYEVISDPWKLLNIFKDYVEGYVLYNNSTLKDPSINNACTLASLNNSIAVDESIEEKVKSQGITNMKGDCRNTDKYWGYNNLWNRGLNHSLLIQLSPDKDTALRDYAIMTKSLIFYEDSIADTDLRDKVFSSTEGDSICLGWGPDEFKNVSTASKHGVSIVAADWSYNLTVLSAFPSLPKCQKASLNVPIEKNVHYVTFIMSDGDNMQWNLGTNYGSTKWYGSPYRGKFNLGWSLTPSLYYLAPTVFNLYYKNASCGKANDYFIVSPSGKGYMYPSKFDKSKLPTYINKLNSYMKNVDEKYAAIIDDASLYNKVLWHKFTSKPYIQGLFYLDYRRHDNYHGKILWSNGKPIVSCRDLLWAGLESEDELVKEINSRINSGQINIKDPGSYTFVYVHVWSKDMSDVEKVVDKLKKVPQVRIVTPKAFMTLVKRNIEH